jgi:hypothetical protein
MIPKSIVDEMYRTLLDLRFIAEQNANDICAIKQEGGELSAIDKMELRRWSSVEGALQSYEAFCKGALTAAL